jgi:uncharacterized protein DUF929
MSKSTNGSSQPSHSSRSPRASAPRPTSTKNQNNTNNQNNRRNPNTRKSPNNSRRPKDAGPPHGTPPEPAIGSGLRRFRSRHPVVAALVPVGLVVAALATMVVIKAAGGGPGPAAAASHVSTGGSGGGTSSSTGSGSPASTGTTALSPSVVAALSVPPSTLDAVGSPSSVVLPDSTGNGSVAKSADGKPLITYIGAEYCPYCAAERWALAVALSRFGTLSDLSGTHSSSSDVYPDTQTLSFYGSTYTSPYVDFQAVEETTNQQTGDGYQPLQTPTAAQTALMEKYDPDGSIPFLDIGNKYIVTGASFSPQILQGLSRDQIAAQLQDPSSPVAQAIDGTANDITAAICVVTGGQPTSVCNTPSIQSIVKKLGA